jgi:hypothetical protein
MGKSFASTLIESRSQKLSLSDCYCLAQKLANIPGQGDSQFLHLLAVSNSLLADCEADGSKRASLSCEPAYHCRRHIADAVLAMGYFLQKIEFSDYEKQLLLLVMLVHDYGHRGIANKLSGLSHEEESISLLKTTALMNLSPEDILFVQECILGTYPQNVSAVANEYLQNPNDPYALMRALVNDADIATSFIPSLGLDLTQKILLERGNNAPSEQEIHEAYTAFKSHARITTPAAREALGLEKINL